MARFWGEPFYGKGKKKNIGRKSRKIYTVKDYDVTLKIPIVFLKLVGLRLTRKDTANPRSFWNILYWFEFANIFMVTWLELAKMVETGRGGTLQNTLEIFRMLPCVAYMLLAMVKSYKIVRCRPTFENIVTELRGMWPQGSVSEEEHLIISSALKQLNYVQKGYLCCNEALVAMFLYPSFVGIVQRALGYDTPRTLPFFFWFPFDPFKPYLYESILIAQTWHAHLTTWFMFCGDMMLYVFLSHIATQFDLLSIRIRRLFFVPQDGQLVDTYPLAKYSQDYERNKKVTINTLNSKEWETRYEKELKEIILRHRALIRLSRNVEEMFGFSLLLNFFTSSLIICFCGFCCVIVEKWHEMVYKIFLTSALSQTWLLCWYGQKLLESSAGVSHALYQSGWYTASQKIKTSVLIMLHRTQKNVHITTKYGFAVIALASYTTIIKTAWSYFTLLLNIFKQ